MEGVVKFFNRKKGFGFITGDDGQDYFVHFTAIPRGVFINDNDRVSFEGSPGDRGLKADKIAVLQKAPRQERENINQEEPAQEDTESEEQNYEQSQ